MNNIWSAEIDSVLNVGRNLEIVGVRNWALDRESALKALRQFSVMKIAVLGGDVYTVRDTRLESTYDNWYCNARAGERGAEYVARSIATAKQYIANYPANAGDVLFAIVPSVPVVTE